MKALIYFALMSAVVAVVAAVSVLVGQWMSTTIRPPNMKQPEHEGVASLKEDNGRMPTTNKPSGISGRGNDLSQTNDLKAKGRTDADATALTSPSGDINGQNISPKDIKGSVQSEIIPNNTLQSDRESVLPILKAIEENRSNNTLRASLVSDIRRNGKTAVVAAMPELVALLENDNDPNVRLVTISALSRAPQEVPAQAIPILRKIADSVEIRRDVADQARALLVVMGSEPK